MKALAIANVVQSILLIAFIAECHDANTAGDAINVANRWEDIAKRWQGIASDWKQASNAFEAVAAKNLDTAQRCLATLRGQQ